MVAPARLALTSIILTVTGIFVAANIYTLIPIYEEVAAQFGSSRESVVVASSLFTLLYAVGLLFFGPASDRVGRKNVIVIGIFASCLSTLAVALTDHVGALAVARAIQGLTLGSFAPVAFAYTFDLYSPQARTLLLVCINAGFLMAGMLGQLISSALANLWNWQAVYYFFSGSYFVLFLLLLVILPQVARPQPVLEAVTRIMRNLLKKPLLQKSYLITFTLLFTFVAFYDGVSRVLAGSEDQLLTLRVVGLLGTILALVTGRLIDWFGLERTMLVGVSLGVISLGGLIVVKSFPALMVLSILLVATIAILIPCMITFIGGVGGEHKAKALSLYSFVLLTGASFASPLAAWVSYQTLLWVLLALFLGNGMWSWKLIRSRKI